jgi:hypothetical protein
MDVIMITRRGKLVRALAILAGVALIVWMSGHVWINGTGICIGTLAKCGL